MKPTILEMDQISKGFPGVQALLDVNFDLYPGEVHALMGENGAGKSTLVKILTGVYVRDSGTMTIEGKEKEYKNPKEAQNDCMNKIKKGVQYVIRKRKRTISSLWKQIIR